MKRTHAGLALIAALSTAAVVTTPAFAQSRSYDCRAETKQHRTTGTVVGALAGAFLGSQVAGRGARTEGTVIGALAGGLAGNAIGKSNARGEPECRGYRSTRYRTNSRYAGYDRYDGRYDNRYRYDRYDTRYGY